MREVEVSQSMRLSVYELQPMIEIEDPPASESIAEDLRVCELQRGHLGGEPHIFSDNIIRKLTESRLYILVGDGMDTKPRSFQNALRTGWGEGSCFISSGAQLLFASQRIQLALAAIVEKNALSFLAQQANS